MYSLYRPLIATAVILAFLIAVDPAAAASEFVPAGPEFQVNTYTTGDQGNPSIAAAANGDFVIAWQSISQDGDDNGVFAQRYASDGSAQGPEFQVNTYTTDDQESPSIAAAANGDFVIAWDSDGQDGDYRGVFAQRHASDGSAQGPEFQVNTYTTDDQERPSIAAAANGDFVIAWHSRGQDGDYRGVFAQRYASDGSAQGAEFQVNSYTTGDQESPSIAAAANGDFVIAWQSISQDGDDNGVFAQRYASDGTAQGAEFQVNTHTENSQNDPDVAAGPDGDFVIAWRSTDQDGDMVGVFAQRFASDGTAQGAEFQVNSYTTGYQSDPDVAVGSDGDFIIAWRSDDQDGDREGVFAQCYASDGTAQGAEFQVNTYTTGNQNDPDVSVGPDDDLVIVWQSRGQDGGGRGIFVQRYLGGRAEAVVPAPTVSGAALVAVVTALSGIGGLGLWRRHREGGAGA